jgi:hypothetical protein
VTANTGNLASKASSDTSMSTGIEEQRSKSLPPVKGISAAQLSNKRNLENLSGHFIESINRYEQNGLKRIKAKRDIQTAGSRKSSYKSRRHSKKEDIREEVKQHEKDAHLMRGSNVHTLGKNVFSESEDERCVVNDENEEAYSSNNHRRSAPKYGGGSFKVAAVHGVPKETNLINRVQSLVVNQVSAKKPLPNFFNPTQKFAA